MENRIGSVICSQLVYGRLCVRAPLGPKQRL